MMMVSVNLRTRAGADGVCQKAASASWDACDPLADINDREGEGEGEGAEDEGSSWNGGAAGDTLTTGLVVIFKRVLGLARASFYSFAILLEYRYFEYWKVMLTRLFNWAIFFCSSCIRFSSALACDLGDAGTLLAGC